MRIKHLSEKEIQQYALDKVNCGRKTVEHVQLCEECKNKAAMYESLFTEIKTSPKPVFDFDVSTLVLAEIAPPKLKLSWIDLVVYLATFAGIVFLGIIGYTFRKYVFMMFSGISTMLMFLILTTALIILVILTFESYKKYQKLIHKLDFY